MRDIIRIADEIINMKKNMDRLFENFFRPYKKPVGEGSEEDISFTPPVNAVENNDEVILYILIPFAKKEDISINIKDGILSVEGKTLFKVKEKSEVLRDEIPTGYFSRSFKLAMSINPSKVKASYKDGILQINLPKKEEVKGNRIEIE
ncbi:MAG: Hsp20/alpha crystallin family protein [Elusimicrobiales bacterium]